MVERRTGFKPDPCSNYLAAINTEQCARPNSSAVAGIVCARRSQEAAAAADVGWQRAQTTQFRLLGGGSATSAAHEGRADTARSRGRAEPSRALFRAGAKNRGGVRVERSIPGGLSRAGSGSRCLRAPAPHARSSLTGRRSKFIWAPEKGSACV